MVQSSSPACCGIDFKTCWNIVVFDGFCIADLILYVAFRSETNSTPCHCGLEFYSFEVPLLFPQSFCSQVSDCRAMPKPTVGVSKLFGLTCLKLHRTLFFVDYFGRKEYLATLLVTEALWFCAHSYALYIYERCSREIGFFSFGI